MTAQDVFDWLRTCGTCGKPHERRLVDACTGPPDHQPANQAKRITWGDPVDGHSYRKPVLGLDVDQMQAMYEAARRNQESP